eukprot:2234242-Rhodomonas_salina.1
MDALFVHPPASKQGLRRLLFPVSQRVFQQLTRAVHCLVWGRRAESKAQAVFDFLIDLDRSSSHDRAYCFESTANPRRSPLSYLPT